MSVLHYYRAMANPAVLTPSSQTAEQARQQLESIAQHAMENDSESLWWLYIGLHDQYVRQFNPATEDRLPGFPDWKTAVTLSFPPMPGWVSFHNGQPLMEDHPEYAFATTCLLHALGAISTSDMDTLSIPTPERWRAPVWVLSALTTTSHWPAMMCQLQQTAQDVPSVSRLDCAWAPEASWQWRCVTQGPLRGILSDDAAFDALDALRFSPHMNERSREMVEDYFKAEYPGLEQRCVVAFSLGGPIGSPKEKPWIQPLPALESEP